MDIDNLTIILSKVAKKDNKPVPTLEEVTNALVGVDDVALTASWRNRIEVSVWDGISNINAATPEYVLESNPWADKIYLLLIDGTISYMQTHDPVQQGYVPITSETIDSISSTHADSVASQLASEEIFQQLLVDLDLA